MVPGPNGSVYVTGMTTSTDYPTTQGAYQRTGGTNLTAFLGQFTGLNNLSYSTYFGSIDDAHAVNTDPNGNALIGGQVYNTGFIPSNISDYQWYNNAQGNSSNGFWADISPYSENLTLAGPGSWVGASPFNLQILLSSMANQGGAVIGLQSNNPSFPVPATVTIPAGQTSIVVKVPTIIVSALTPVAITANYNGLSAVLTTNILPHAVKSLVLSPTSLVGGNSVQGTVTLAAAAGSTDMILPLTSSNTAAVQVPPSMTIKAGATSGVFTATTSAVNSSTNVTIKAANDTNYALATVTVKPPAPKTITFSPTYVNGGVGATGTVTLNGKAGSNGAVVTLLSHNTAALQVPASAKVPAGATSANFTVTTAPVDSTVWVQVTGTFGTAANGDLQVLSAAVSNLSLSPATVTGGNSSTGTVTLGSAAGPSGVTVTLSSANHELATVPASVIVAAGKTQATFPITTFQVTTNSSDLIYASQIALSKTATLSLLPESLTAFTVSPGTVQGGTNATGTVTLAAPIGSSAVFVNVLSNTPAAANPQFSQVDVGTPGQKAQSFVINTFGVDSAVTVTLTASYNGVTKNGTLIVNPAQLTSLGLSSSSVKGGTSLTGTVTLTGPAGPSGTVVGLKSGSSLVGVPSSVKVPAGKSSVQFNITTSPVTSQTSVVITASWNTLTKNATLTLTP